STPNTLADIAGRVSFSGDGTLTEAQQSFVDTDPRLQIFLTTPNVIIGDGTPRTTDDGHAYQRPLFVPVLIDTNTASTGSPLNVRVVVLTSLGAIQTALVQEKGVLEHATQKTDSLGHPLWFDAQGLETTSSAAT